MTTLIALIYLIFEYCVSFRIQVILRPKFSIRMKPKKRNKWKWLHKWAGLGEACKEDNVHMESFLAVSNFLYGQNYSQFEISLPALMGLL